MTKLEFYNEIAELLELEDEIQTNAETELEEVLEIDSLAHITLISYIKDEFGIELKAESFAKFVTLQDIVKTIGEDKFS